MATRSAPQSAINNILDFLMFFNSGKTCPVTHDFITNKITGAGEQITRRYNDFYLISAFIASEENWDQNSLGDLLASIDELEKTYNHVGLHHKWFVTKLDIIFQIGLSILRDVVDLEGDNLPEDLSGFSIPSQISVAAYRNKIVALREKYESYYTVEETGDQHAKYVQHFEQLVDGVVINEDADKGSKKPKRGAKKSVLSKDKVYELLEEHRISTFTDHIVKFIQSVEEKALQIPLDVGCYSAGAGESLSSTLRRLSKHHLPDWTDAEAEAMGPYSNQHSSARKTRAQTSSAAVGEEAETRSEAVSTSSNTRGKAAAASASSSSSSSKAVKEAVVEPPATRSGKTVASKQPAPPKSPDLTQSPVASPKTTIASASASASGTKRARKSTVVQDDEGESDDEDNIAAISRKISRKYADTDPLTEAMGIIASSAKARVSREAELSAKKATPSSAAAKTTSKGKTVDARHNPFGRAKRGESVDFSESEEAESIDEASDADSTYEAGKSSRAVAQLLRMRKNIPQVSTKFPAKLETPTKGQGAKSNHNKQKNTVATERANAIATGKRIKWTLEEELVLEEAVMRYGEGNWANILEDPEYSQTFVGRTNVNLKDKWRNILKSKSV